MGKTTIEWTATYHPDGSVTPGYTFNPWIGCQKVSPGCQFCYAERDFTRKPRWANTWGPPATTERKRTSDSYWRKPLTWNRKAQEAGKRMKVFCASLADVFEDAPQVVEWRDELFQLIDRTPWLDWLILTKRPENIKRLWPWGWYDDWFTWPNIWLGVSAENQEQADKRIPLLLQIPAAVRFVSAEPLLGAINLGLDGTVPSSINERYTHVGEMLHWVIVGGESGPGARPMHPDWARSLRDQCQVAGVPFFFKQWGAWGHPCVGEIDGWRENQFPTQWIKSNGTQFNMVRCGKKRAGRVLDGRTWSEMPEAKELAYER